MPREAKRTMATGNFRRQILVRGAGAFFVLQAAMLLTAAAQAAEPLRVMTFNIRYGDADDGPNRWPRRREMLLEVIREFDPDVLGVQEALRYQLDEIGETLPEHVCVGVGREADGGGEYSAIFYRRTRFDLLAAETFWLSDTPEVAGSHTWGNQLPRVCTWARLVERVDGRRLAVFNTHWDHIAQPARLRSGELMAERIAARCAAGDPVLVTGDFNAAEDNPAIAALTRQGELLRDSYRTAHPGADPAGTFHGFRGRAGTGKIDAVLVSAGWEVREAAIVRTEREGRFPSDHFPVTAAVAWPATDGAGERVPGEGP
jgi:endonuclease/exonuclease/phosphatase family metal-dependent hydrolase